MSHKVGIGKHAERTLEWLFFNDPGFVWWLLNKPDQLDRLSAPARGRLDDLVRRARHLVLPGRCPRCRKKPITRMLWTEHRSGGLARVDFRCEDCGADSDSPFISTVPSFDTPDVFRSYDKLGGDFLVKAIKRAYFGADPPRMTQKKMEEFFDNPANFANP